MCRGQLEIEIRDAVETEKVEYKEIMEGMLLVYAYSSLHLACDHS